MAPQLQSPHRECPGHQKHLLASALACVTPACGSIRLPTTLPMPARELPALLCPRKSSGSDLWDVCPFVLQRSD